MSLTLGLSAALSGLQASKQGLDLVSNNIANMNTPGFSRKLFNPTSRVLAGYGVGVEVAETTRRVDEKLRANSWQATGLYQQYAATQKYFDRLQDLFGKPGDNTTIAHTINNLSTQFEQAAINTGQSDRTIRKMQDIAYQMNTLSNSIQDLRAAADQDIYGNLQTMNAAVKDIAVLNERIVLARATKRGTADLEDKRDTLLGKINEIMDVQHFVRENGAVVMYTASGVTLIDSVAKEIVFNPATQVSPTDTFASGQFSKMSVGVLDITGDIRQGKLKSLIEVRDRELPDLQAQLDELATKLRTSVNEAHNRGTSFPAVANAMIGSRSFIPDATTTNYNQTISLQKSDVNLTVFNTDGSQKSTTTLNTIMTDGSFAGGAYPANGPWTIDQVASRMQSWLRLPAGPNLADATVKVNAGGTFEIQLNTAQASLGFRDQVDSSLGAEVTDATILFDANHDGNADETVKGFANFFGLNDLFHKGVKNRTWDSTVISKDYYTVGSATLQFSTDTVGINFATVSVLPGDSLRTLADRINGTPALADRIIANVIPDGTGERLRLSNLDGGELVVTSATGATTAFGPLQLAPSDTGNARSIVVNPSLTLSPSRLHRGKVQFNPITAQYYVSVGDNSNINEVAKVFTTPRSYNLSGGLATGSLKLTDYGAAIVSNAAGRAATAKESVTYQQGLSEALVMKDAQVSQVNLDEELSQLMIFEQSYSAAAKVISTTKQMLDILNDIIR
ncbi:flagellar hook-associated protein FlgK [Haematospirillum sp. H1815]|uniref:flagellar hook-associated protein FlgK n=1 Tax=Haematospirillum sp. H1815 TaxID=2723108 RepID=UPI00143A3BBF|nr:flagellar hook-associated protein FlgK [Haematospirillum sp. H1815]NKD77633.1 flagellar hook-associated protein FlgK [Haematospirillum sp. H1815]